MRNGSDQPREKFGFGGSCPVACFAPAESVFACYKVVWRVFVAVWAVCFGALSCAIGNSTKSKTGLVNVLSFADDFLKRKIVLSAFQHGVGFQSCGFGKFRRNVFNAVNSYFPNASAVQLLLRFARPSTIFRGIGAVIVNAVDCVPFGARPHVLQEIQKSCPGQKPSLAYINSASSVVPVEAATFGIATPFHACPNRTQRVGFLFSHSHIMTFNGIGSM